MSDTYSYEVLEPGGHARLVGNVLDRISKASANPASAVGSSRAMLGDPETASWMQRTTAADGAALIESVYGNTIVQDGSLLPVRMEGIETVGFNLWDEVWEVGSYSTTTGTKTSDSSKFRCANPIPVFPSTVYYIGSSVNATWILLYYDADGAFISSTSRTNDTFITPSNCRYVRFCSSTGFYGTTYNNDICINISDTTRNGEYEPYWSSQFTIPATDLRSAGTVYDEQTATERITRVGAVDLGTLTWIMGGSNANTRFSATLAGVAYVSNTAIADVTCVGYEAGTANDIQNVQGYDKRVATYTNQIWFTDSSYESAAAFKAAMSGVMLHYALATPTTTPIDPPLPMSYRVGAGGTERVMVASGTTSAPPIFATRYPLDPADLAASIAPVDGPTATTNHQVGDLLMLGFTLCKATQVIVTGETIEIGTNVTRTSVAAELAALSE